MTPLDLKKLLFGSDELEALSAQSKTTGDTAKVLIRDGYLGDLIKLLDTQEEFLHVESFPTHSEVWLTKEWKESNARRDRLKLTSEQQRTILVKNAQRITEIKSALLEMEAWRIVAKSYPGYLDKLASDMLANLRNNQAAVVMKLLNIAELLNKYNEEDK